MLEALSLGMKLATQLHLVPSIRMRGAMPPLHSMPSWRVHGKGMVVTAVCLGLVFILTLNELFLLPTDRIPRCHVILKTRTIISLNSINKLMFVVPCIIVKFLQKNPTRCNSVSKFYYSLF